MTILYQFTRVVNCFYVFNAILQSTPSISTNSPLATIIPLSFVICVGIFKELVVEIRRWLEDKKVNNLLTQKLVDGQLRTVRLQDVQVGDILRIQDGQSIPADCVLL